MTLWERVQLALRAAGLLGLVLSVCGVLSLSWGLFGSLACLALGGLSVRTQGGE